MRTEVNTTDMFLTLDNYKTSLEKAKNSPGNDLARLNKLDRELIVLAKIKAALKVIRYFGGLDEIQETLKGAIAAKQPSLFPVEEVTPDNQTALNL
jgi:hypothetical protein